MSGHEDDHVGHQSQLHQAFTEPAWTSNPLLNIEKAIALKKLRREVRLKIVLSGLSREEINLLTLHRVEGLTPKRIAEKIREDVELIRYQLLKIERKIIHQVRALA
jgi:DNA-directed RNA polymerase specialized sigma24 family protein